jgi:hypothetical protein
MKKNHAERLLSGYLFCGVLSIVIFILFALLLSYAILIEQTYIFLYFILLLTGFLWIGVTAIARHVFVLLKKYIGKEIHVLEFLSTQFIVVLLPFLYIKLRKEVRMYNKKMKSDNTRGTGD